MDEEPEMKYFFIEGPPATIDRYMGGAWEVIGYEETEHTTHTYFQGYDLAGYTLEGWLRPRLESGLWFGIIELTGDPFNGTNPNIKAWPDEDG